MPLTLTHLAIAAYAFWECWQGARQLRVRLLKALVFGIIGVVHGLVPVLASPWYVRTAEPYAIHLEAAQYALAGTLLLGLGWRLHGSLFRSLPASTTFDLIKQPQALRRLEALFIICAIGGVLAWMGGIFASGATLKSLLSAKRLEFRGEGNGLLGGLCGHLFCMAYVPGFLGLQLKGRLRTAGVVYAVVFAVVLFLASKGTRAGAVGLLGSLIAGKIYAQRISLDKLLLTGAAISVIALLAVAAQPLRHRMSQLSYADMAGFLLSPEAYQDALEEDPLNYHEWFVSIVNIFPSARPFVNAASYRRILFFYLPGERFSSLKPRDPNRIVAEALFGQLASDVDWMHPPGIFGDVYLNFWGWKGLPVFVVQGMFLCWLSRQLTYSPLYFLALGPQIMYLSLVGMRGQPYTIAITMLATLSVMFVICKLLRIPLKNPRRRAAAARTLGRPQLRQVAA